VAVVLHNLGSIAIEQGDYQAARPIVEETLSLHRQLGYKEGLALSFLNLGNIAHEQGDFEAAKTAHEESLSLSRELGDKTGVAFTLLNLGHVARSQGDNAAARQRYEESLTLFRELGEKQHVFKALVSLGDMARRQGEHPAAHTMLTESLTLLRELEDKQGSAVLLEAWASLVCAQNLPKRAATLWGAAKALREAAGTPLPPSARADFDDQVAQARAALNEDEFAQAFAAGRALTWEQAVAYALQEKR
jgi:tetratricopeptide (TPR) repeat protein